MPNVRELRDFHSEMQVLTEGNLGLERVWTAFGNLCEIPRASGNEAGAITFVKDFVLRRGFEMEEDPEGNILFFVPSTTVMEDVPGIVFQGHLDMVSQGEPSPTKHGVVPYIYQEEEKTWVTANGTTLGADNGIGVSLMLALTEERIPHGPLAFLLTNREEIGLVSAIKMSLKNKLSGYKFLYNLDSEEEGEATISSAGAADTFITYSGNIVGTEAKTLVDIELKGLMGGHSGIVIGDRRLNAAKVITTTLLHLHERLGTPAMNLVSLESGTARNAIPKDAKATIAIDEDRVEEINSILREIREEVLQESTHDEELQMVLGASKSHSDASIMYDDKSSDELLNMINDLPDGLITLSNEIPGFPETSTNIGIVKPAENGRYSIQIMSRSSKTDELTKIREIIKQTVSNNRVMVDQPAPYSGWPPILDSQINQITAEAWQEISGQLMKIRYTHGGLECGVLLGRFPHLQAISIGPEIIGAHSTEERVNVDSVKRYYSLLKKIIGKITYLHYSE